ncbi:hypothetical protein GQ42DRAFT_79660 [Ramicandelaber brevisporus]|nr:hypothetical protein GQ42DRAFT_79660 [Ramicandelaber brevisporus]
MIVLALVNGGITRSSSRSSSGNSSLKPAAPLPDWGMAVDVHTSCSQHSTVHRSTAQRNTAQRNTAQRNTAQHSTPQHSMLKSACSGQHAQVSMLRSDASVPVTFRPSAVELASTTTECSSHRPAHRLMDGSATVLFLMSSTRCIHAKPLCPNISQPATSD